MSQRFTPLRSPVLTYAGEILPPHQASSDKGKIAQYVYGGLLYTIGECWRSSAGHAGFNLDFFPRWANGFAIARFDTFPTALILVRNWVTQLTAEPKQQGKVLCQNSLASASVRRMLVSMLLRSIRVPA